MDEPAVYVCFQFATQHFQEDLSCIVYLNPLLVSRVESDEHLHSMFKPMCYEYEIVCKTQMVQFFSIYGNFHGLVEAEGVWNSIISHDCFV